MNYFETFNFFRLKIFEAFLETIDMVFSSFIIGLIIAIPVSILLYETRFSKKIYVIRFILNATINIIRSIPFLIFIVVVMPLSYYLIGTSFGSQASKVPLSLIAFALITKTTEQSLQTIPSELTKTAYVLGASKFQMYKDFYIIEIRPHYILGLTQTLISILSYSSVMGAIAGGGLGDLAIRYGYQEYHPKLMIIVLIILVLMVQIIQMIGYKLANYFDKTKEKRGKL